MATAKQGLTGPPRPPPNYVRQDGPRAGGFAPLNYARNVGRGTPKNALALFAIGLGVSLWGFHRVRMNTRWQSDLRMELREVRAYIIPYLQAEEDQRCMENRKRELEEEHKIMDDVRGWNFDDSEFRTRRATHPPHSIWVPYE